MQSILGIICGTVQSHAQTREESKFAFPTIVLMAVCDAHYVFTLVNIGDFSSNSDSDILQNSALGGTLGSITLGILDPEPLEEFQDPLPYYSMGDDIFV